MEQFETRFKQVDVFPMVKHFMNELDLYNLFTKYVPTADGSLANHAESLCILTANIICDNKPLYKVQQWLSRYSDGFDSEPIAASHFRVRARITSHFDISSSGHFRQILKIKNLEIVHYYCAFCSLKSTKPDQNLSAENVNLFMREP